ARPAEDESDGADRGAEQVEAAGHQRDLSEKDQSLEHDGRRRARRLVGVRAAADARVTAQGTTTNLRERRTGGTGLDVATSSPGRRAVKDRRSEGLKRVAKDPIRR